MRALLIQENIDGPLINFRAADVAEIRLPD